MRDWHSQNADMDDTWEDEGKYKNPGQPDVEMNNKCSDADNVSNTHGMTHGTESMTNKKLQLFIYLPRTRQRFWSDGTANSFTCIVQIELMEKQI